MIDRNVSRLEKHGTPAWAGIVGAVVLMLIFLGTLTFFTLRWVPHGGRVYATLAFLWILAVSGLVNAVRRWRATGSTRKLA
jgi:hypothetical protein